MKVKELVNHMNDYGTKPRVEVFTSTDFGLCLIYEGSIKNIDEKTATLKVNSFTVLGKGFLQIYAESKDKNEL